jgi:hypothetical protein
MSVRVVAMGMWDRVLRYHGEALIQQSGRLIRCLEVHVTLPPTMVRIVQPVDSPLPDSELCACECVSAL